MSTILSQLRDYSAEIDALTAAKMAEVKIHDLAIWKDHLPAVLADDGSSGSVPNKIEQLDLEVVQKAFDSDLLKLATDMSKWSAYQERLSSSVRKQALSKVLHMKQENRKGLQVVIDFMDRRARFRANSYAEEHFCVMEAGFDNFRSCNME